MPISVAVIAKDEADRITACLKSVPFADDIVVVVDDRSRDDTYAIAESFGSRVSYRTWPGYAKQKQYAVDQCKNDWVLILDADERVPEETAGEIGRLLIDPDPDAAAYAFLRKNIFHEKWIRRCGWWPDRVVRLVHRKKGRFSSHLVHEHWSTGGRIVDLNASIEHHSFRGYADLIEKMQSYSTLAARQLFEEGQRARWCAPVSHGVWMFIRTFLLELGVLEGFDGFVISILNAGGSFMKYAKLREIRLHGKK